MRGNLAPNMNGLIPYKKGQTGNPAGRPKGTPERTPDFRRARDFSDLSIETLAEMMQGFRTVKSKSDDKKPRTEPVTASVQIYAAITILERAWGKAPQALHVQNDTTITVAADETSVLEKIRSRIDGIAARIGADADLELSERGGGT